MGSVYLAEHERLNRLVAIKVLHPHLAQGELAVARFEREVKVMARIRNSHVAEALDADVLDDGSPFLVMEYLEGRDLRAELKLRSAIPFPEAVAYIVQACEGVAAVHELGVIHRDLKPHNLFVTNLKGARQVKVLDFGVAKFLAGSEASLTAVDGSVGTPLYMSPEQLANPAAITQSTDVWALGVVLYMLIAGVSPFAADSPGAVVAAIMFDEPPLLSQIVPDVPVLLAEILVDALAKSPSRRIGSARELGERLAPFGMPLDRIVAPSLTTSRPPAVLARRRSIHPELSARVASEVDRQSEKFHVREREQVTKSDQLLRIPNVARLSASLTSSITAPWGRHFAPPSREPAENEALQRPVLDAHSSAEPAPSLAQEAPASFPATTARSPLARLAARKLLLTFAALTFVASVGLVVVRSKPSKLDGAGAVPSTNPNRTLALAASETARPRSTNAEPVSVTLTEPGLSTGNQPEVPGVSSTARAPTSRMVPARRPAAVASAPRLTPTPFPIAADGKPLHL